MNLCEFSDFTMFTVGLQSQGESSPVIIDMNTRPAEIVSDSNKQAPLASRDMSLSPPQPAGSGASDADKTTRGKVSASSGGNTESSTRTTSFSINDILGGSPRRKTSSSAVGSTSEIRDDVDDLKRSEVKDHHDIADHEIGDMSQCLTDSCSEKMAVLYPPWTHPYFYRKFHSFCSLH